MRLPKPQPRYRRRWAVWRFSIFRERKLWQTEFVRRMFESVSILKSRNRQSNRRSDCCPSRDSRNTRTISIDHGSDAIESVLDPILLILNDRAQRNSHVAIKLSAWSAITGAVFLTSAIFA